MDQYFLTINSWIGQGFLLGGLGCFLWGMVSVLFSPCHLASIPLIIGYVGGQNQLVEGRKATLYAIVFTTRLFITIVVAGSSTAMVKRLLVSSSWQQGGRFFRRLAGALIAMLGVFFIT